MSTGDLAFTWWGHASVTVEIGGIRIALDPLFTDQLISEYNQAKANVTYKTYAGVDHGGIVTKSAPAKDATKYVKSKLG